MPFQKTKTITTRQVIFWLLLIPIVLAAAAAENTFFRVFTLFGKPPTLILPLVAVIGMKTNENVGGIAGVIGGVIEGELCGSGLWILPVFYLLIGYMSGAFIRTSFKDSVVVYLIVVLCGLIAKGFINLILADLTFSSMQFGDAILKTVFPELLESLLWAFPTYLCGVGLCRLGFGKRKA